VIVSHCDFWITLVGSPGDKNLDFNKLFEEIQRDINSPKKHYLEGKELISEPKYGNEKANYQIQKNLKKKIQKIKAIEQTNSRRLQSVSIQPKEDYVKYTNTEIAIPSFVTHKIDYQANHTCSRLDRISCDNSLNFISQCSRSIHSNCNLKENVLDCRKETSEVFYTRKVGDNRSGLSVFGPNSKCVRIKSKRRRKMAICANIQCDISRKFYYIMLSEEFGKN
jgi:hypothetical protein